MSFLSALKRSMQSPRLLLLSEAFTSLLPIVLVMNILGLFSGLTQLLETWGFTGAAAVNGGDISRLYYFLIPLFLNLSLSTLLAKEKDLEPISTMLVAMVCFFRITGFLSINANAALISYHGSILTSVPSTWLAVKCLQVFSRVPRFRLVRSHTDLNPRLRKTLNLLIPGILTVLCFELISLLLQGVVGLGLLSWLAQWLPKFQQLTAWQELALYKLISLLTWFFGIHGEHSAEGLFRLLNEAPAGATTGIRLKTFHDVFMNIGGSGSTLAIPLLLLLKRKQLPQFQSIARLSLPFSLFNVNEILLFGLPIILNPIFLIPLLLAPFINLVIASIAIQFGLFSLAPVSVSWMAPPLYSAYQATNGSIAGVIIQLICLGIDGCIYLPFLVLATRQSRAPSHLRQLFGNDAYDFVNEEIRHREERRFLAEQQGLLKRQQSAQKVLQQLRGGEFILYFQPKIDAKTLELVGLETLLRCRNADGQILPPSFLTVLYQQGLSKAVDKKVVSLALDQVLRWRSMGLSVPPIAINFDKDFLLDRTAVQAFIRSCQLHDLSFYIEITEHTYTVEMEELAIVVEQLRAAGHCISIDDFGSGYSSLTSLLALKVDEIKLDRKLVVPPLDELDRGELLLASSVQLCHDLGFSVVAEGIETPEQLHRVQRCGVDTIQGYYLGKPMPAEQVCQRFPARVPAAIPTEESKTLGTEILSPRDSSGISWMPEW